MKLRRKPNSFDDFLDDDCDPKQVCREEDQPRCDIIAKYEKDGAVWGWKVRPAVRFSFDQYGNSRSDSIGDRFSDFAVDVEWRDVVEIIATLARAARGGPRKDSPIKEQVQPPPEEKAIIAAITVLAVQLGIDTSGSNRDVPYNKVKPVVRDVLTVATDQPERR